MFSDQNEIQLEINNQKKKMFKIPKHLETKQHTSK